ncbi:MAG: MlaD family protein [Rikenellaceae bacterium]
MKKEVKIGIFTILIILCAWGGIRFLSSIDIFSREKSYYAYYDRVDGVQRSASVYLNGVKIGSVVDISLDPARDAKVKLTLLVSNKYQIPADSKAKIIGNGIMSSKAIDLIIGESSEVLASGDTITSSNTPDILEMAGSELSVLKEKLEIVVESLATTLTSLNTLIEANSHNIGTLIENTEALTKNLNSIVSENQTNINQITDNFATLSESLGGNSSRIDSILMNLNEMTTELNEGGAGASMSATMAELNTLLSSINSEEGNISKLLGDEKLYENITSATANLDSLLIDVKENPGRYVKVSVFGRDEEKLIEKREKRAAKVAK